MRTPSDHAGADLRVSNPKTSAHFIEALNDCNAPLPWAFNEVGQITDAADAARPSARETLLSVNGMTSALTSLLPLS